MDYLVRAYDAGQIDPKHTIVIHNADSPMEAAQDAFGMWFKERADFSNISRAVVDPVSGRYTVEVKPDHLSGPGQIMFGLATDNAVKQATCYCDDCTERTVYTENPVGVQSVVQWALRKLCEVDCAHPTFESMNTLIGNVFEVVGAFRTIEEGIVPVVRDDRIAGGEPVKGAVSEAIEKAKETAARRIDEVLDGYRDVELEFLRKQTQGLHPSERIRVALEQAICIGVREYVEARKEKGMLDHEAEMVERTMQHAATCDVFRMPLARCMLAADLTFDAKDKPK